MEGRRAVRYFRDGLRVIRVHTDTPVGDADFLSAAAENYTIKSGWVPMATAVYEVRYTGDWIPCTEGEAIAAIAARADRVEIGLPDPTIRRIVKAVEQGSITVPDAVVRLRSGVWPRPRPPAKTVLESYLRAEDLPDDNDPYWIDEAYSSHIIEEDTWLQLREALRDSWRPSGIARRGGLGAEPPA